MATALRTIRRAIENLAGVKLERVGKKAYFVIDASRSAEAWYSYNTMLGGILEESKVTHVLDVGAHVGNFGRRVRSFYKGRISSFEPVASTYRELAAESVSDRLWDTHQYALGSASGTKTIHVSSTSVFSSILKSNDYCRNRFGPDSVDTREETITVRRLDDVLDEIGSDETNQRMFLKLDTQGYDLEAFRGMGEKLRAVVALQSEISLIPIYENMPHWTESITLYERAGFSIAGMYPVTRDGARVIEYDCLLVKSGA